MSNKAKNNIAAEVRTGARLPELLAPAGSYDALRAAIEGGADAIYMGGVAFNARINAKNFTEDELTRGIALAHSYGARVYITANTATYDRETDAFLRAAEYAYNAGADALIIADLGAAAEVRRRIPIELHASTQCSSHSSESAKTLAEHGFSRVVCAREMSRRDLESFIDASPLEAEVFVHGALCVCHSGQCLFSSLVGGRSGNRGECAQPCRLPYRDARGVNYPLSLKDLTLAAHVPELCKLGVASLKIEGRMKSPEYVRDVTSIWRRLLDERRGATAAELRELEAIFSRGGFTDGYFTGKTDRKMLGVRSEEQKRVTRELAPFEKITRRLPLDASVCIKTEQPMTLTLTAPNGKTVTATGEVPLIAKTAPTDKEAVRRSLAKLGDTAYVLRTLECDIDDGLMVPVSLLNALRRRATELLCEQKEREGVKHADEKIRPITMREKQRTAMFFEPSAIPESAYSYFDIIYTPLEKYTGNSNGVALPAVIFDSEREEVSQMLARAKELGASHALVGNIGHISLAREAGLKLHGDFRLNVTNNASAAFAESLGFEDFVLLPELTLSQIRDIGGKSAAIVYGHVPLMVTEKCVGRELGSCDACNRGTLTLRDRKGVSFPILRTYRHRSLILNSVPFYMADKALELSRAGVCMQHFIFTSESAREAEKIIKDYQNGNPTSKAIKRIK